MSNNLGNEIQTARIQQGYTTKEVAQMVHISAHYLSDIEHGRRIPAENVLYALALNLNINFNYAYYLINKYPPNVRGLDIPLTILDKALGWLQHPYDYTLRKTK